MHPIESFSETHHSWANHLLGGHMGSRKIVSRGTLYDPFDFPGFVALYEGQPAALATYRVHGSACELLTIHSQVEGKGLGTVLLERTMQAAHHQGCTRFWLITTNDNTHAIRWYQMRGFTIAAVYLNALEASRKLKPEIPLTGFDGIPLRDEIEFERSLMGFGD